MVKTVRKGVGPRKRNTAGPAAKRATSAATRTAPSEAEAAGEAPARSAEVHLDGAVDALRRLLSELIETRLESVARDLAELRRETVAGAEAARLLELVDDLLDRLGAVRFSAEALDAVDPLIHTVVEERRSAGVPRGVILEAVRPGFRSGRGLVLCKAAVAVSGG